MALGDVEGEDSVIWHSSYHGRCLRCCLHFFTREEHVAHSRACLRRKESEQNEEDTAEWRLP